MEEIPLCMCGCGKRVKRNAKSNSWRKFIRGHFKKWIANQEPPLCSCGCGQKVRWNAQNGEWREYVSSHGNKYRPYRPYTEERKRKIGESSRKCWENPEYREKIVKFGKDNHFFGKEHSEESKSKMSKAAKKKLENKENHPMFGKEHSEESKKKMSRSALNKIPMSEETKRRISESHSGENHHFYGKKLSPEHIEKLRTSHTGKFGGDLASNWKGGITKLNKLIRSNSKYKKWRGIIFGRDNYTCQYCGERGCFLHAHHKKRFFQILIDNFIGTIEQAMECNELWDVTNGITLCKECHKDEHSKINLTGGN